MLANENGRTPILQISSLSVNFATRDGIVQAVRDVSFDLYPGEALGIVGESGCGKSVTALSILKLIPPKSASLSADQMSFNGTDLLTASAGTMRKIRGNQISMIFQDPMTCLNPVLTIGKQMSEVITLHRGLKGQELRKECIRLLEMVGISAAEMRLKSYPHQLSGGMRQRVMIAMGVSCNPAILLADEPTTALDVTIQDQILRLIRSLAHELDMSIILITHNFGAVAGNTDRIVVMYAGKIVETAKSLELFHNPRHPYTIGLLQSIPSVTSEEKVRLFSIPGNLPNPIKIPEGCSFAPRCEMAIEICTKTHPELEEVAPGHHAACWRIK
jgi:oligopeptide/dipeptide ABC transporter ATP-binding protein